MDVTNDRLAAEKKSLAERWTGFSADIPLIGWLLGALVAVLLEQVVGTPLARGMLLPKVPVLFGCVIMLKKPMLIPSAMAYVLLIYILPIGVIARLSAAAMNRLASKLLDTRMIVSVLVHILMLYAILHIWAGMSDYRLLVLKLTLIAVMLTLSLNVINGYMGEFSCSHPGFMALGAYGSSVFTVALFANDRLFGEALLSPAIGPFFFPVALFIGGMVAALGALVVAIPSFRTRGDYLAIISLAFTFIVKSPPATPAQKALNKKASILVLRVFTVMASAAISLSRTALSALPIVERTKLLMIQMHITAVANTTGRLAQSGCCPNPRGPPTNSRFSIRLLTIKVKASEIMAR